MAINVIEARVPLKSLSMSTRVLRSGSGAPVLLLHGSPDSAGEWERVMRTLGGKASCIAPDLPGLGKCDEPPTTFDYSRAANSAFLDELLKTLAIDEPVVLAVHDIGGIMGIPWAAERLHRIRGVVITNTVIFEQFPWFAIGRTWARTGGLGRLRAEAGMAFLGLARGVVFRRIFGRISPELPTEDMERMTREFALSASAKRSTLRLFRQMVPTEFFTGAEEMLRALIARVPVQVVWGGGDPYIPARYANEFPGAKCELVERGGHWVPISSPEQVASAICAVLAN